MPVRAIKKIASHKTINQGALSVRIPDVILNAFKIGTEHYFVCEIRRHFDKNKKLVNEVNETGTFASHGLILPSGKVILLSETSMAQKYGFVTGDYIEVIFLAVEEKKKGGFFSKKEEEVIKTEIFPERTIDDLDFNPD